jgi:hypothetical protein
MKNDHLVGSRNAAKKYPVLAHAASTMSCTRSPDENVNLKEAFERGSF